MENRQGRPIPVIDLSDFENREAQILDILNYGSYAANRDYGMTHEQLLSIGIGNEKMKAQYEKENKI